MLVKSEKGSLTRSTTNLMKRVGDQVAYKYTPIGTIPAEWDVVGFKDSLSAERFQEKEHLLQGQFQSHGKYPIVDQGSSLIAGYTNDESLVHINGLPIVIFGDHTRIFKYVDFPFVLGADGTKVLKPEAGRFDARFFYYCLTQLDIPSKGYSRHYKYLKEKFLVSPPLPEQHTIAAILSKIQQAIGTQEKIIEQTKELKKSLMAKLFTEGLHGEELKETEIGLMPKSWEVARLGNFVRNKITDGTHVTPKYQDAGVKFVTATNLRDEKIDFTECKLISLEEHERLTKRCKPEVGDILLSKVGTLGLVAKVEHGEVFSIFVQVALIKPKSDMLDSDYLLHAFVSDAMQAQISQKSSTSTMKYIGVGKIAELVVPIPAMEEQREIAGILKEVNLKIYNGSQKVRLLRTLFKSMLHQLMMGQIRVNNIEIAPTGREG